MVITYCSFYGRSVRSFDSLIESKVPQSQSIWSKRLKIPQRFDYFAVLCNYNINVYVKIIFEKLVELI